MRQLCFLLKVQTFPPVPTDPTPEKSVISPNRTGDKFRTFPMVDEPQKCDFTGYMGRVICSLSFLLLFVVIACVWSSLCCAEEPLVPLPMDYDRDAPLLVDHSHFLRARRVATGLSEWRESILYCRTARGSVSGV